MLFLQACDSISNFDKYLIQSTLLFLAIDCPQYHHTRVISQVYHAPESTISKYEQNLYQAIFIALLLLLMTQPDLAISPSTQCQVVELTSPHKLLPVIIQPIQFIWPRRKKGVPGITQ